MAKITDAQLRKLVLFSSLAAAIIVAAVIDLFDHGLTRTFFLETLTALTPAIFARRIYQELRHHLGKR